MGGPKDGLSCAGCYILDAETIQFESISHNSSHHRLTEGAEHLLLGDMVVVGKDYQTEVLYFAVSSWRTEADVHKPSLLIGLLSTSR